MPALCWNNKNNYYAQSMRAMPAYCACPYLSVIETATMAANEEYMQCIQAYTST